MTLGDRRTLSWAELGSTNSSNVLLHNHGAGSSRLEMALYDDHFADMGLRVIAPERPGYGSSSPARKAWSVADWVADVSQLLDLLGIDEFAESGYSGGCPFALAIAASPALGRRVTRLWLRAPLAPGQEPRNPRDTEIRARLAHMSWSEFVDWYEGGTIDDVVFASADLEAFADPAYASAAMASLTEGARQGSRGGAADQWALGTEWGFELDGVVQPVVIWHGDADTMVPVSHSVALGSALPNATVRILPGDGHYSIGVRVPEQLRT